MTTIDTTSPAGVVFVPMAEILDTPGVFGALSPTPAVWTERLRAMLAEKGLDTSTGSRVYDMRTFGDERVPPGWLFCNAAGDRDAYYAFRAYLSRPETGKKRENADGPIKQKGQ